MKRVMIWLSVIVLAVIITVAVLIFVYSDRIKSAVITELNKHLLAEVVVHPGNIDVTLFSSFPDCELTFRKVLVRSAARNKRDTLLYAGRIGLRFNVLDIWRENYIVKSLVIGDAVAHLSHDRNGRANYNIWKSTTDTAGSNVKFSFSSFRVNDLSLDFNDAQTGYRISAGIRNAELSGTFGESRFDLRSDAKFRLTSVSHHKKIWLKDKDVEFAAEMNVADSTYKTSRCRLVVNGLELDLDGTAVYGKKLGSLGLNVVANDKAIAGLRSLLTDDLKKSAADYEIDGELKLKGRVDYTTVKGLRLSTDFALKNGEFEYKPKAGKARLTEIAGRLEYTPRYSAADLSTIQVETRHGRLRGSFHLENFDNPFLLLSAETQLDLAEFHSLLPVDTVVSMKGAINAKLKIEGSFNEMKQKIWSETVRISADVRLAGCEVLFKRDSTPVVIKGGDISLHGRTAAVDSLSLTKGKSDFRITGKIPGLLDYVTDRTKPLVIHGSMFANRICAEDFMGTPSSANADAKIIPDGVECLMHAAILEFSLGKFQASAITGELEIKRSKLMVSDMKFSSMDGECTADAWADNSGAGLSVFIQGEVKQVDLSKLLGQMNNFSQDVITNRHISGSADAVINLSGSWDNSLKVIEPTLRATCAFRVTNGILRDFTPLYGLSKFIRVEDLKSIRFSTLTGSVSVADRKIIIPHTSIKNSALNVEAEGTHSFDNVVDYRFRVVLSELIAARRKQGDDEFGPVTDDNDKKRMAFIRMKGPMATAEYEYDYKGLREKVRDDFRKEMSTLKKLFREETSGFRRDTADDRKPQERRKPQLEEKKRPDEEDF